MTIDDWTRWHTVYDQPGSSLQRRLQRVRARVGEALDVLPAGPVRVLSMCAGQGRDLIPVLATHRRGPDVRALLVELDPDNAAVAAAAARESGLDGVEVVAGDASLSSAYADVVPVDLALVCGVFGNLPDEDVRGTIQALPGLVRSGGRVIWTRHRREPDLTPSILGWFADAGFVEVGHDGEPGFSYGVGVHELTAGAARAFEPGVTLFRFVGQAADATG